MSIIRSPRPQNNFTIIANDIIRNQTLTRGARALLIEILSYPDNWRTNSLDLARAGLEGRDAIRRMLKELEAAGYCSIVKMQDPKGRWSSSWYFYDSPRDPDDLVENTYPHRHEPVNNLWETTKKGQQPETASPASDTQALLQDLPNKDYAKNSATLLESQRPLCGQCKGQGLVIDSLDMVQKCASCRGDGIAR